MLAIRKGSGSIIGGRGVGVEREKGREGEGERYYSV